MRVRIVADGVSTSSLRAALAAFNKEKRENDQPTTVGGLGEFCQVALDGPNLWRLITPPISPKSAAIISATLHGSEEIQNVVAIR